MFDIQMGVAALRQAAINKEALARFLAPLQNGAFVITEPAGGLDPALRADLKALPAARPGAISIIALKTFCKEGQTARERVAAIERRLRRSLSSILDRCFAESLDERQTAAKRRMPGGEETLEPLHRFLEKIAGQLWQERVEPSLISRGLLLRPRILYTDEISTLKLLWWRIVPPRCLGECLRLNLASLIHYGGFFAALNRPDEAHVTGLLLSHFQGGNFLLGSLRWGKFGVLTL